MATNYDIAFLRVAMRNVETLEKSSAMRCLQVIDEQTKQGRTVSAMQVAVGMGLLGEDVALKVDAQTRHELGTGQQASAIQSGAVPVGGQYPSAIFRRGAPPPPPPAPSSSGAVPAPPPPLPSPTGSGAVPAPPPPLPSPTGSGAVPAPPASATGSGAVPRSEWYDLSVNGEGLDDFQLGPKLGRGPVGASYRGRKKSDASDVIVKVISRRFQQHDDHLNQITQHLEAWRSITHPQLSEVVALGLSNGRNVVVYRVAMGKSLDRILQEEGPLPPSKALRVVYEIGQVLAEAEKYGLAHGDVRAEKVYFNGRSAFLVDPGLARASALASGYGQHGLAFGHPNYLAPEVLQENQTDPTPVADVYALGVLFYTMVCGKLPFTGEPLDVLRQHFESPLPPPPPEVTFSTTIAGLILKMTAKTPGQRLGGPSDLVESINRLLQGKPMFPAPTRVAEPMSADDWGRVSHQENHAGHSQDWTTSKIDKVAPVGPSSLGELDAYATQDSARIPSGTLSDDPDQDHGLVLGDKMGRGTVGTTYSGTMSGKKVVIKVVSKRFAKYPDLLRRILKCIGAASSLDHPNIVKAYKAMHGTEGRELIVYERAVGKTLREQLEAGPLRVSEATLIVSQIAEALSTAGARGVYHGDIRPEKVYVEPAGRVRVADFGLAEAACLGAGYGKYGMHFGHPRYLAPEALQESLPEPTPKTDVYALGILYYELVCGHPPYEGPGVKETLKQHLEAPIPPPPDEVTVPGEVAEVILRMTAKDPARRLASPVQVASTLEPLMGMDVSREASGVRSGEGAIHVSEFTVDEFDPTMQSDPMSADAWGLASEQVAQPSGEWDVKRIEQAPKVGPAPDEWEPDTMAEGGPDDATLSAAIQQATLEAAAGAALKTRKKGGRGASARQRKAAPGGEGGTKSKLPLIAALGGGVLLLAVIGVVAMGGHGDGGGSSNGDGQSTGVATSGGNDGTVSPPKVDPALAELETLIGEGKLSEAEAKLATLSPESRESSQGKTLASQLNRELTKLAMERELEPYQAKVRELIQQRKFKEASLEHHNLSETAAESPQGKKLIEGLVAEITALAGQEFLKQKVEVERLRDQSKFDEAHERAERMRVWALDAQAIDRLQETIRKKRDARWAELIAVGKPFPRINPSRVRARLQSLLGQSNLKVWDQGQFHVAYPSYKSGKQLLTVLKRLKGRQSALKLRAGKGLSVNASEEPVLLQVKVPLAHLHEIIVHLETEADVTEYGQVSILVGPRKGRLRSSGLAWGIDLIQMQSNGQLGITHFDSPKIPARKPVTISLKVQKRGSRVSVKGTRKIDGGATQRSSLERLKGDSDTVAIYVKGAEVTIVGIELSGVADAKGLE